MRSNIKIKLWRSWKTTLNNFHDYTNNKSAPGIRGCCGLWWGDFSLTMVKYIWVAAHADWYDASQSQSLAHPILPDFTFSCSRTDEIVFEAKRSPVLRFMSNFPHFPAFGKFPRVVGSFLGQRTSEQTLRANSSWLKDGAKQALEPRREAWLFYQCFLLCWKGL